MNDTATQAQHADAAASEPSMLPLSEILLEIFLSRLPNKAIERAEGDQAEADIIYSRLISHALAEMAIVVGTMCHLAQERNSVLADFIEAAGRAMRVAQERDQGAVGEVGHA